MKLNDLKPRDLAGKMRPLMPEIDRLTREGVLYDDVRASLAQAGIEITDANFRSMLYRWRRSRKKMGSSHQETPEPPRGTTNPRPASLDVNRPRDNAADLAGSGDELGDAQAIRAAKPALDFAASKQSADAYSAKPAPLIKAPHKKETSK